MLYTPLSYNECSGWIDTQIAYEQEEIQQLFGEYDAGQVGGGADLL